MEQTSINGWSYDVLAFQIKSELYERQAMGDKPNNFNKSLPKPQNELAKDMMKEPYVFDLIELKKQYKN